jgi:hypothetical protein
MVYLLQHFCQHFFNNKIRIFIMALIDIYLKQHIDLLGIVSQISQKLNPKTVETEAKTIIDLLVALAGKLSFHLSMEDKSLYPAILNSPEAGAKATAQKFMDEMGGIAKVFEAYRAKWSSPAALQANPTGFIDETKGLFKAVGDRITREEKELYVLAK